MMASSLQFYSVLQNASYRRRSLRPREELGD